MARRYLALAAMLFIIISVLGCGSSPAARTGPTASEPSSPSPTAIANNNGWTIFTDGNHINGLLLKGNDLWAATAGGVVRWDIQTGTYRKYTTFDGMPGNYVQAIAEDGKGDIACGTFYGLGIFDGTRWKTLSDDHGFPNFVSAISLDKQNNLLVDTDKGIFRYDGQTWQPLTGQVEGLPLNPGGPAEKGTGISPKIVVDQAGNIWDVEPYNLGRYDGQIWHVFYGGGYWDKSATNGSGYFGSLNAAVPDTEGGIWIGTSFGLLHYNGKIFNLIVPNNLAIPNYSNPPGNITALITDQTGSLLCAIGNTILRYDGSSWQTVAANNLSESPSVALSLDTHDNLWCGTWDGLYCFDGEHWKQFLTADVIPDEGGMSSIPGDVADEMVADDNGNVWLASYKGVYRFDGQAWKRITKADGLADNVVSCIFPDNLGNVWFGTDGSGVSRFDGTSWTTFTTAEGLSSNSITAIAQDKAGDIWLGNRDNKIDRFDGRLWQTYNTHDILDNNTQSVTSIYLDSRGDLWFATMGAGVMRYDGTKWQTFNRYSGLGGDNVSAITEDSNGNIWFRFDGGASRFDGANWQTFNNIGSNYVHPMAADDSGNIWFGTDQGAQRYDGTNWKTFNTTDGLPNNVVVAIALAQDGSLWFATENGVSHYDGQTWQNYTVADGLATNFNTNIVVGKDRSIWFDGFNEISHFKAPGATTPASSADDLKGSQWKLVSLNGEGLIPGSYISLYFMPGHFWSYSGLNTLEGEYSIQTPGALRISASLATLIGGPEDLEQQERAYLESLRNPVTYKLADNHLEIYNGAGQRSLGFERLPEYAMEPADLAGTQWALVSLDGETVSDELAATLVFGYQGAAVGEAGPFTTTLNYEAYGDNIRITEASGSNDINIQLPSELEQQAAAFTSFMGFASSYRLEKDRLEIFTSRGNMLAFTRL